MTRLTGLPQHLLLFGKVVDRRGRVDLWTSVGLFDLALPDGRDVEVPTIRAGVRRFRSGLTRRQRQRRGRGGERSGEDGGDGRGETGR